MLRTNFAWIFLRTNYDTRRQKIKGGYRKKKLTWKSHDDDLEQTENRNIQTISVSLVHSSCYSSIISLMHFNLVGSLPRVNIC